MSHRILLVDDELHILRAAEYKFKRAGYEVLCAFDGEEAWQVIKQEQPELMISDYQMPRLDGIGLVKRIRECPETAALPVVLLTAKGFDLARDHQTQSLGVAAILGKPFSPRELLALTESLLNGTPQPAGLSR
jgi:DNA-binding response OmpR family regulator